MTPLTTTLYFTTSTVIDWVDIFSRPSYRHVVVESLDYCQRQKGLRIYAWVLMTNHLHMVVSAEGTQTVGDILRDFKKFTNKKILKALEEDEHESRRVWMLDRFRFAGANDRRITNYRFWQEGNHVEEIYTAEFLWQKVNYIHQNPVRAEIVTRAEDIPGAKRPSYSIVYDTEDLTQFFTDINITEENGIPYLNALYKGKKPICERIIRLDADRYQKGDLPLSNLLSKYCSYIIASNRE